jgi:PAS domain S-box-containing protein
MDKVGQSRNHLLPEQRARRLRHFASVAFALAAIVLVAAVFLSRITPKATLFLFGSFALAIVVFVLLMTWISGQLRHEERVTSTTLQTREQEFQQMADNIQEIFWVIDAETKQALYVNHAYETITGRSRESLTADPSSYANVIHPDDRAQVLSKLDEAARCGNFDEKFRIVRGDRAIRWVWVRGFAGREPDGRVTRLGGTALDITELKTAEAQVAANLAMAQSARTEAEVLSKATLALTQDLRMNNVMDALLRSLAELVPYTCARVLVPDGGPHVLALGERFSQLRPGESGKIPLTLTADGSPFARRILSEKQSVLIPDSRLEQDWPSFTGHCELRSWLSVPLVAAEEYLGFLSVGHAEPNQLTEEHLRRAQLLAIPAAIAIQNARLFATADIYGSELEKRLADLQAAERALTQSESERRASEEKFQKIFHASPISFSITTFEDGRFLEVNAAFERQYGYSREELIGHTVRELGFWSDWEDRRLLLAHLRHGRPARQIITRLRAKSGEIRLTAYSADRIQFDGQSCIFAVSEDILTPNPSKLN